MIAKLGRKKGKRRKKLGYYCFNGMMEQLISLSINQAKASLRAFFAMQPSLRVRRRQSSDFQHTDCFTFPLSAGLAVRNDE